MVRLLFMLAGLDKPPRLKGGGSRRQKAQLGEDYRCDRSCRWAMAPRVQRALARCPLKRSTWF